MKNGIIILLVVVAAYAASVFLKTQISADTLVPTSGPAEMRILLQDEVGSPLDGTVYVTSFQTSKTTQLRQKNSEGYYTLKVSPGSFSVDAEVAGYVKDGQNVTLEPNDIQEITFNLQKE